MHFKIHKIGEWEKVGRLLVERGKDSPVFLFMHTNIVFWAVLICFLRTLSYLDFLKALILQMKTFVCQNSLVTQKVTMLFKLWFYVWQLFVYIFSCLFTFSAVCLHFQLFVYYLTVVYLFFDSCLFTFWQLFVYFWAAVCLHCSFLITF